MADNDKPAVAAFAGGVIVLFAALAILPSFAPSLHAEGEPSRADTEIDRLVEQLGHDEYEMRQAAQKRLVDIGPPAEEAVRKALEHPDPEIRRRADIILKQIKWQLSGEYRERLGGEVAERWRNWETLEDEERMRLFVGCIWILGDDADALCFKVLRHEKSAVIIRRATRWFAESGRGEHIAELLKISEERRDDGILFAAASLALRCGRPDIAINALKKSEYVDVELGLLVAGLYEQKGAYEKAEELYRQLSDLEPRNIHFGLKLAEMSMHRGKKEKALETLLKMSRDNPSAEALLTVLNALNEYGFNDEAAKIADKAARKFGDYRFSLAMAGAAEKSNNGKGAIRYYFEALRYASRDFEIFLINASLAERLLAEFGPEKTLADLGEKAAKAEKDRDFRTMVYVNLLLAQIAANDGRVGEAKKACKIIRKMHAKAVALSFVDLPATLGEILERAGAWEEAAAVYQETLDAGEAKRNHILALGRCRFKMSDKDAAVGVWRLLVDEAGAKKPANYALLIDILLAHGMTEEAGKAAGDALQRYPKRLDLVGRRLKMLLDSGDTGGATLLITDTMLRYEPYERSAVARVILQGLPKSAELQELIEKVTEQKASAAVELMKRAEDLAAKGKKNEAAALCRKILAVSKEKDVRERARRIIGDAE